MSRSKPLCIEVHIERKQYDRERRNQGRAEKGPQSSLAALGDYPDVHARPGDCTRIAGALESHGLAVWSLGSDALRCRCPGDSGQVPSLCQTLPYQRPDFPAGPQVRPLRVTG